MLEVRNLDVIIDSTPILEDVSLTVADGEVVGVLGRAPQTILFLPVGLQGVGKGRTRCIPDETARRHEGIGDKVRQILGDGQCRYHNRIRTG